MSDRTTDGRPPRKGGPGKFSGPRKPFGKPSGGKPGGKTFRGKSGVSTEGGRPVTGRNAGDKPFRGKPSGDRPFRGKAAGGSKPFGARPFNDESPRPAEGEARSPRPRHANPRPDRARSTERTEGGSPPARKWEDRSSRPASGERPPRRDAAPRSGRWEKDDERKPAPRVARPPARAETPASASSSSGAHGAGRIAKVIARAGACSRRDAEAWILEGRVTVNGVVLDSPAHNVSPDDRISIDGKPLASRERTRLFMFNKPRGLVTTNSDPEGRPTIFDALPDNIPRLISVGRLDINTEGLMLLTNDGGLARVLELPATGWLRRYRVRAHGETDQAKLDALMEGVTIDGIDYRGIEAKIDREQGANVWMTIGLREGKNREVKRVLESLGLDVNRLIRVSYGPFQLGELGEGEVEEVTTRILKDQLGERLSEEAEADFEGPIFERRGEVEETWSVQSTGRRGAERPMRGGRPEREERPLRHENRMFSAGKDYKDEDKLVRKPGGRGFQRDGVKAPPVDVKAGPSEPGKRKHVTALRDISRDRDAKGNRMRVEKSATSDRKGRPVKVERRVAPAAPERDILDIPDSRNARRFAEERGERPMRRTRPEGEGAPRGERPPKREWSERPPRGEGRPPRDETRAPRSEGRPERSRDDRPGKTTYAARSSGPRSAAPRDGARPKSFGGKPGGGKPSGGRPFAGKPGGRPSGGGKPSGGRPPGGGARPPRRPREG